jgi:hypothetical protein
MPSREGYWREAVDVPVDYDPNKQYLDGYVFDINQEEYDALGTPVRIIWNVKDKTVEQRKGELLNTVNGKDIESITIEMQKEVACAFNCYTEEGCCTETLNEIFTRVRARKAEILLLSTHDEIDAYMAANQLSS